MKIIEATVLLGKDCPDTVFLTTNLPFGGESPYEAIKQIPVEYRKFTPGDILTSTFVEKLSKINSINVSKSEWQSQEAATL